MAQKVDLGIPSLLCTDFAYSLRKFKAKLPYVVRRHIPPESVKYTFSGGYAKNPTLQEKASNKMLFSYSLNMYYTKSLSYSIYSDKHGNRYLGEVGN
jgi:hypothetical protein